MIAALSPTLLSGARRSDGSILRYVFTIHSVWSGIRVSSVM